jgi:ATPase subunit of ABC transporter with duplicated ATPase domains
VPVLLVSHDERDAQALAEEQWLVEDGRLQRL